jgi:hypothetical protein
LYRMDRGYLPNTSAAASASKAGLEKDLLISRYLIT